MLWTPWWEMRKAWALCSFPTMRDFITLTANHGLQNDLTWQYEEFGKTHSPSPHPLSGLNSGVWLSWNDFFAKFNSKSLMNTMNFSLSLSWFEHILDVYSSLAFLLSSPILFHTLFHLLPFWSACGSMPDYSQWLWWLTIGEVCKLKCEQRAEFTVEILRL